jgi:cytochrome c-type biogenesis protein CcmE
MKTAHRNQLIALGAILVAAGALAYISFGNMGESLVYYWTPSEMLAQGEKAYVSTIRLGGVVQKGSLNWQADHARLEFRVADDQSDAAKSVAVVAHEVPPQMFREGIGVVVEGTYDRSSVFRSNRLMVNHSNEYRPPKPGESKPDEWKESLGDPTAAARP